jgi:U1 small nuclear ribonucleoprotein
MTAHLPPSLLALFAPRPPLPYVVPEDKPKLPPYSGVSNYLSYFEDPVLINAPSGSRPFETRKQRKERIQKEKWEKNQLVIAQKIKEWAPSKDPKATGDPYKTLFVGRINYNTSELKLRKEFENWGSIKKIRLVLDQKGKPRGYAFVEFEREKDMKAAYKEADGKKIDGKRIVVDYERGRTSKSWRPRRFGGGRGFSRAGPDDLNQKYGQYR